MRCNQRVLGMLPAKLGNRKDALNLGVSFNMAVATTKETSTSSTFVCPSSDDSNLKFWCGLIYKIDIVEASGVERGSVTHCGACNNCRENTYTRNSKVHVPVTNENRREWFRGRSAGRQRRGIVLNSTVTLVMRTLLDNVVRLFQLVFLDQSKAQNENGGRGD